jgi:hypothetical protein
MDVQIISAYRLTQVGMIVGFGQIASHFAFVVRC